MVAFEGLIPIDWILASLESIALYIENFLFSSGNATMLISHSSSGLLDDDIIDVVGSIISLFICYWWFSVNEIFLKFGSKNVHSGLKFYC